MGRCGRSRRWNSRSGRDFRLQGLRRPGPTFHLSELEVLNQDVAPERQPPGYIAPFLRDEVKDHAAFVAVAAEIIGGFAPLVGRAPAAGVIALGDPTLMTSAPRSPSIIVQ